jgi:methylmalonyl-CoA mutase C-terminal domain/subunit
MLDAGFDVHYTGPAPDARAGGGGGAARERRRDRAVVSMAGAHLPFCTRLKPLLEAAGLG